MDYGDVVNGKHMIRIQMTCLGYVGHWNLTNTFNPSSQH